MKKFVVTGMSCAACSARVERAVSALDGVASCSVNLLTGTMTVEGNASVSAVISAVERAGYGANEIGKTNKNVNDYVRNSAKKLILVRLISSCIILVPLMYISMGYVMLGLPLPSFLSEDTFAVGLAELILSALVLIINAKFFINGVLGVIRLSPNMDTLVSLGAGASFVYSSVLLFVNGTGGSHSYIHGLYFESAAMILVLISVGKLLEARAKGKTTSAIYDLMELAPKTAVVLRDGAELTIPAEELAVGDIFVLRPGYRVPSDAVVTEGESSINEASLTGESMPKDKTVGDTVLAGTVNLDGYLKCRAIKVGEDTAISEVIRLVTDAAASKAPIARVADRVSGIFVPVVMGIALITFMIWKIVGAEVGYALGRAISVLVISCPCALGLATPVAIMVGTGVGARHGILYKSAEAIELLGRAKVIALDKTGTVTRGEPSVTDVVSFGEATEDELLSLALSVEEKSEHPLARAVCEYAVSCGAVSCETSDFAVIAGAGVKCNLGGSVLVGASFRYISDMLEVADAQREAFDKLSGEGKTPLFFALDDRILGAVAVSDTVRDDSAGAVCELHELGLRTVLLTGDNARAASFVGTPLGFDEICADMLPSDKAERVVALSEHGRVIMVGDGINDAPSLAAADVGIAVGGGTDIAIDSADVVLMRDSLSDVSRAVRLGRAVLKNIYQNLFWAFIYNIIGIPLAAGAFVFLFGFEMSPMIAALAMSVSSFSVVMNALRLNLFSKKEKKREKKEQNERINAYFKKDKSNVSLEKNESAGSFKAGDTYSSNAEYKDACQDSLCADKTNETEKREKNMTYTMKIEGMMCPHCEARVKAMLEGISGVEWALVSHVSGEATVTCSGVNKDTLSDAVTGAGYKVLSID